MILNFVPALDLFRAQEVIAEFLSFAVAVLLVGVVGLEGFVFEGFESRNLHLLYELLGESLELRSFFRVEVHQHFSDLLTRLGNVLREQRKLRHHVLQIHLRKVVQRHTALLDLLQIQAAEKEFENQSSEQVVFVQRWLFVVN